MTTGDKGIALIKEFEGLRLEAYRCPAGVLTIGYGHTAGVKPGQTVTPEEAGQLLRQDLATAEQVVNRECRALTQPQFDALVSFVFNVGEGNFRRSTLLKCILANPNGLNIRTELARWNKSKGTILAGLIRRRKAEADLYFS